MYPKGLFPFILFCSEYRPQIKRDHPGLSIGDLNELIESELVLMKWSGRNCTVSQAIVSMEGLQEAGALS